MEETITLRKFTCSVTINDDKANPATSRIFATSDQQDTIKKFMGDVLGITTDLDISNEPFSMPLVGSSPDVYAIIDASPTGDGSSFPDEMVVCDLDVSSIPQAPETLYDILFGTLVLTASLTSTAGMRRSTPSKIVHKRLPAV